MGCARRRSDGAVAGTVAGADGIDGMDVPRHGAMSATFGRIHTLSTCDLQYSEARDSGGVQVVGRAHGDGDGHEVLSLGAKLRATRQAAHLSVEALAAKSGVSSGLISQLERGQGNPSFLTLRRLASSLGVPLGHFLEGPDSSSAMVVRAGERKRLQLPTENGLVYELLTPNLQGALEVLRSQIPPGFDNRDRPFQHTGEECVYMLTGSLRVCVGSSEFVLDEGDSITYDSGVPHWWLNASGEGAVIFGVVTPPSF